MATQELRINRLEELMSQMVDNQTATLRMLHRLESRVENNATIISENSKRMDSLEDRLENVENLLVKVVEELVQIKEILASSRGMGFVPEPGDGD